jgi:hypothetical protein
MAGRNSGFSTPVPSLLTPIASYRGTRVVPDEGTRMKAQFSTGVEQSPADVDVVPRPLKYGIKSADFLKRSLPEGHVAARNMFGSVVG